MCASGGSPLRYDCLTRNHWADMGPSPLTYSMSQDPTKLKRSWRFRWREGSLWLLPCLVLLMTTLPHLEQGDFRRDTGRYAAVGLSMWQDASLWRPQLNPETPYFDKPPLALWIHGWFLKVFGVHLAAARAPSILAALGVVSLTVSTAARIGTRTEALASGLILALTYEFFRRTREISLDLWQLLFLMLSVYLVVSAAKLGRKPLLVLAGLPLGLALLCKPLQALATLPVLGLWLAWLGRPGWWKWLLVGTLPVAVLVALPWHLLMWWQFGEAFLNQYFFQETVNRFKGLNTPGPIYFYLHILAQVYWPWVLLVAYAFYVRLRRQEAARRPNRDLVLLGGSWFAYVLLLLTLFPSKQVNYSMPLFPMLSWVAGAGACRLPWMGLRRWRQHRFAGLAPAAVLVLAASSLAPVRFQKPPDPDWQALFTWLDDDKISPAQLTYHRP